MINEPKIKNFFNYLYYIFSSMAKNVYPCKLIGEKTNNNETIIVFKILGKKNVHEIPIKTLFNNQNLLESFSPEDALKLGIISFGDIVFALPEKERKEMFETIKQKLLTSSNFINVQNLDKGHELETLELEDIKKHHFTKNKHNFHLVGVKNQNSFVKTVVLYTIMGKKEGYEIPIADLINNKNMLAQFCPTDAVKLGFIVQGDNVFF